MKKINKVFTIMLSVLTATTVISVSKANVQAAESTITINEIHRTPINDKITTDFLDNSLVGKKDLTQPITSSVVIPMGVITEKYNHSYYSVKSYTRTGQAVGPRQSVVTYASIAKGESRTVADETELSGSVTVGGSYNVNAVDVIKASISGSVTGKISHKWSVRTTLVGPPESSSYNTRLYSHAVDFDQYSYILNKYDVYYIYNNGNYYSQETRNGGTTTVNSVKKPIFISFSKDVNY